ncbi:RHS repeat-associated core domain-containing protein [Aquitalea aquatica]|uniref:RHS domain-containing protein n=1 Tax=Aquitalea aquatica TaxID=3044273 RepID=A0A838YGN4_9NEIS|nr:RHS repeat-associated core domain-containing protein [Aquitalea magnusonii]MBA4710205.1 RHS domain-containing protein [Aquitalea magnusonii]
MTTAAARPVAVLSATPQNAAKVLEQTGQDFDKWLRSISDGHLSVETLKTVAAAVPVVGNLISIGDVVVDVVDMCNKSNRREEVDVFDWLFLGVDLVGVVPAAGGLFKAGVRPTLKLCATSLRRAGKDWAKAEIEAGLAAKLISMLPASYRNSPAEWVKFVDSKIEAELKECGAKGGTMLKGFADLLTSMGTGKFGSYVEQHVPHTPVRYNLEKTNDDGLWGTISAHLHAIKKAAASAGQEAASGMMVTAAHEVDGLLKGTASARLMQRLGAAIATWAAKLGEMLMKMYSSHLKPLLEKLARAFLKHMPVKAGAVVGKSVKTVSAKVAQAGKEVAARFAPKQKPAPPCACATSGHAIGYAFGEETFEHTDFSLPGVLPIVWSRRYRSDFAANDQLGELGARWTLPYLSRFDIDGGQLKYHDGSGRTLEYPLLAEGLSHKDAIEGYTLTRLSDTLLSQAFGHDLIQLYEKQGDSFRLAMIKDRAGNSIAMGFTQGRLSQLISSAGHVLDINHDAAGRIVAVALRNPETGTGGRVLARYRYTEINPLMADAGDLVEAWDENDQSWAYQYSHHLVTRYTDRTGRSISLEWDGIDSEARAVREYADDGSLEVRLAWDDNIDLTYVTDAYGRTTEYYFDEKGYNYRIVYPDHKEEWFDFDEDKRLISHVHPDGSEDRFSYDDRGNMVLHERRDGSEVAFAYDDQDNLIEITDPLGEKWLRAYDDKGQLIEETDPLGHKTKYAYNEQGLPVAVTDAKGGAKKISYRPDGLLESYTDCSGSLTQWQYDERGRSVLVINAMGSATRYQYGDNGGLRAIVSPDGQATQLEHDAESRLLKITDPLGRSTHYDYDKAGRLQSRTDANGHALAYRYDKLGRLISLRNENHRHYLFEYDEGGRVIAETGFDGAVTRYRYDAAGRLVEQQEGDVATHYRYDRAGRLIERSAPGSKENFGYDPAGRLFKAKNRYASLRWVYDPVGNVSEEHHGYHVAGLRQTFRWRHEYDELGNRIATLRPDGHRLDVLNYGSGHVHGLLFGQHDILNLERDKLHRETQRTLGNSLQQTLAYDKAGRLSSQRLSGATRWSRQYQYDAAGQLTGIADNRSGQTNYRYDPVGRLLEAATPKGVESFRFDPAGNLLDNTPTADGHQDNSLLGNLLSHYAGRHYRYDSRGNLIEKRVNGSLTQLEWDGYNRLSRLIAPGGDSTEYRYDPLGRRIAKLSQGKTILYGWDGDVLAFETHDDTAVHYLFEPGSFIPLAQVHTDAIQGVKVPAWNQYNPYDPERDPLLQAGPEPSAPRAVYYYHADHLGTPQALTDAQGQLALEMDYQAWGEAREVIAEAAASAGIRNPFRFQGQYHDDESGLHYNRYRYYDPEIGRFISRDPIGLFGGLNIHKYADNPIEWVDPWGLKKAGGSCALDKSLAGVKGDKKQAQHIIPQEIWNKNENFFDDIGMAGMRDHRSNGVLMPDSQSGAVSANRKYYHNGSHANYSRSVDADVSVIRRNYETGRISAAEARVRIGRLQDERRSQMRSPLVTGTCPERLS